MPAFGENNMFQLATTCAQFAYSMLRTNHRWPYNAWPIHIRFVFWPWTFLQHNITVQFRLCWLWLDNIQRCVENLKIAWSPIVCCVSRTRNIMGTLKTQNIMFHHQWSY